MSRVACGRLARFDVLASADKCSAVAGSDPAHVAWHHSAHCVSFAEQLPIIERADNAGL